MPLVRLLFGYPAICFSYCKYGSPKYITNFAHCLYHIERKYSHNKVVSSMVPLFCYCEHPTPLFLNSFSFEPSYMGLLLESGMAGLLDHLTFVGHWLHPTGFFIVDHVTGCVNLKCWNHNLLQCNKSVLVSCGVHLEPL